MGQPILFWLLFGTGMHSAFQVASGDSFMSYYLPGTTVLILLFTAIFATISIIEDRREGFLQSVLVAPVPRWTIAGGKILGGSMIAWVQSLLFLLLAIGVGSVVASWKLIPLVALLWVASMGLTALGVCFAWPMESTQGFHAIMNLVLMPLWLLSGAFFPIPLVDSTAPFGQHVMHWIMRCNPISYTIAGIRQLMVEKPIDVTGYWQPSLQWCWIVTVGFCLVACLLATRAVGRPTRGDLR